MISSSREADFEVKEGGDKSNTTNSKGKIVKTSCATSSSWPKLKDPRIVRVCRAFGGKDRHSKVTTVRGLRDRRVRLSVPTAIQLYDLQERLGFNQPSKVVDWLLNEAKHEIDELPPLQFPPGSLGQNYYQLMESSTNHDQLNKEHHHHDGLDWNEDQVGLPQWYSIEKHKDGIDEQHHHNKDGDQLLGGATKRDNAYVGSSHMSSLVSERLWNQSSNFSMSQQMGTSHGFTSQVEDLHNMNFLSNTSLALPSGNQNSSADDHQFDPKQQQANNFNFLSSNNPTLYSISQMPPIMSRPFHLSMNMSPKLFLPQDNNNGSEGHLPTKR